MTAVRISNPVSAGTWNPILAQPGSSVVQDININITEQACYWTKVGQHVFITGVIKFTVEAFFSGDTIRMSLPFEMRDNVGGLGTYDAGGGNSSAFSLGWLERMNGILEADIPPTGITPCMLITFIHQADGARGFNHAWMTKDNSTEHGVAFAGQYIAA